MHWFDGSTLKAQRKAKNWTQQQAAEKCGISRLQIIEIEKGTFTGGLRYLRRYLDLLNLEIQFTEKKKPQFDELQKLFAEDD